MCTSRSACCRRASTASTAQLSTAQPALHKAAKQADRVGESHHIVEHSYSSRCRLMFSKRTKKSKQKNDEQNSLAGVMREGFFCLYFQYELDIYSSTRCLIPCYDTTAALLLSVPSMHFVHACGVPGARSSWHLEVSLHLKLRMCVHFVRILFIPPCERAQRAAEAARGPKHLVSSVC